MTDRQGTLVGYALEHARGTAPMLFKKKPDEFRCAVRYAAKRAGIDHCTLNDLRRTLLHLAAVPGQTRRDARVGGAVAPNSYLNCQRSLDCTTSTPPSLLAFLSLLPFTFLSPSLSLSTLITCPFPLSFPTHQSLF